MNNETILENANLFFPGTSYLPKELNTAIESGDLIIDPEKIGNLLKSALHDEAILEVILDDLTRVFFCRALDHTPELEEIETDGLVMLVEPEYTKAEYLDKQDHVIITPLEPSIGNFLICSVNRVILRILSSKCSFELGCFLDHKIRVRGMPVLQCTFPLIAQQVKGGRAYRAKIPDKLELLVHVERQGKRKDFSTCPIDISVEGMLLIDPFGKHTGLKKEEKIWMELNWPPAKNLRINAKIIHISQLRDNEGIQYCCGVQFDLATRSLAREVEQLVTGVQRKRLRKLSDISDEFGLDLTNW